MKAHTNLNKLYKERELLLNIEQNKIKKNYSNYTKGLSKILLSNRKVEDELLTELYKINTKKLDESKDPRYGNGIFSDYQLFNTDSLILKNVEKDLNKIMSEAVNSNIFIIESFFNILKSGSGLKIHTHLNKFDQKHNLINKKYSLTYYLTVGDQECSSRHFKAL